MDVIEIQTEILFGERIYSKGRVASKNIFRAIRNCGRIRIGDLVRIRYSSPHFPYLLVYRCDEWFLGCPEAFLIDESVIEAVSS